MGSLMEWGEIRDRSLPTYRQIDYWIRTHAITPTRSTSGSGTRRGWTDRECLKLEALHRLDLLLRRLFGSYGLPNELVSEVWAGLDEADSYDVLNDASDDGKARILLSVSV